MAAASDSAGPESSSSEMAAKKDGRKRIHYTSVKMAPCKICGGKSTGYHFGVVSCEACKAFFRRALAKDEKCRYMCQKGKDCTGYTGKVNSCYDCRLKRCIEAGMSKNGVRRGRYSIELRLKSILEANRMETEHHKTDSTCAQQKSQNQNNKQGPVMYEHRNKKHEVSTSRECRNMAKQSNMSKSKEDDAISRDVPLGSTNHEDCLIRAMVEGCSFDHKVDSAGENADSTLPCLESAPGKSGPSDVRNKDISETGSTRQDDNACTNQIGLADEAPLPPNPQPDDECPLDELVEILVKIQATLSPHHKVTDDILEKQRIIQKQHQQREEALLSMFGTTEYASSNDFKDVLSKVNIELDDRLIRFREKARAMETSIVHYIYHSKFIPGFKHLDREDVSNLLKASFFEFWVFNNYGAINASTNIAGGSDVVMSGHKNVIQAIIPKELVEAVFQFSTTLQKLDLSLEEISIIRAIILTITDRCPLKEPKKVERLNQLFVGCLQYHIRKTSNNPAARFSKIFDRLIAIRSLTHMDNQAHVQFLKDWGFVMAEFPLWKEIMVSQLPQVTDPPSK